MRVLTITLLAALAACSKSDDKKPAPAPPTGSAPAPGEGSNAFNTPPGGSGTMAGSGGTMAGSGGTMTGSGGTMAGSAAMAGSGDAGSGGGSAVAMGGSDAFDFDKLDHKAQAEYMKQHVIEDMKKEFQAFDAKKFKDFDCKTCHGKNAKERHFEMPTPDIPKLDFVALRAGKQEPKTAEFMGKVVEPKMAAIMHEPVYDPKTNTGFGCLECHLQKGKDAPPPKHDHDK
jgi:hypothetical protein